MSCIWYGVGEVAYLGRSPTDGLEWRRHDFTCQPGLWRVAVTGWGMSCNAVVDDFGNLVRVQ